DPAAQARQQGEQRGTVARGDRVLRHLAVAGRQRRHEPRRPAQLQGRVKRRLVVSVTGRVLLGARAGGMHRFLAAMLSTIAAPYEAGRDRRPMESFSTLVFYSVGR